MNIKLVRLSYLVLCTLSLVSACSVAQLEARLEANPQCKDIVNPKTGALMPCPGSDKAFYREVGLAPAKPVNAINNSASFTSATSGGTSVTTTPSNATKPVSSSSSSAKSASAQGDCKPQIHKKTGGTLPCPAPD
ncbi:hypothetical protein [Polynucleobacter sp. JS-Polo-80-F4]|uniref:hypothetical protein n=1 Tax=Polynucleobacter sp. JS-Polo-80-F4 TaxID=2576918 RepID=UPI001C0B0314|nr:hypothetical protein [Polynucleobacter sp. JS-Polo-80-F4]MBU3617469.1 hypothetical protein [Polynucleobacter sp. JS-Polo-80-F4]